MKLLFSFILMIICCSSSYAQTIVGSWQLMKQSDCMDDKISVDDEGVQDVLNDMNKMSSPTPQVVQFKDNQSGEESTHILNKKKTTNAKAFLYKIDESSLYILDKKSHTISETYTIEVLKSDSLILSNTARACETKIFVRVK